MKLLKLLFVICWAPLALACVRGVEVVSAVLDVAEQAAEICAGGDCAEPARDGNVDLALCPEGKIAVAHNAASSSSLVVCDCRCTSHDNTGWIVWTEGPSAAQLAVEIYSGKLVSPDVFSATASPLIRDLLSDVQMCAPIDRAQLGRSDFTTLVKRPSDSVDFPYCFDLLYISIEGSTVRLKLADRWIDADDDEFFGEQVSDEDAARLDYLLSDVEV